MFNILHSATLLRLQGEAGVTTTHLEARLYLVSEMVDVVVLHGGPLCLPLGGEGDAGRALVEARAPATGYSRGLRAQPETRGVRGETQCYTTTMAHYRPPLHPGAGGQDCLWW